jgi:glyoxylase I family protein
MGVSRRNRDRRLAALVISLTIGGCMDHEVKSSTPAAQASSSRAADRPQSTGYAAVVRYQVGDVERALDFYTRRLGFQLEQRAGSAFASVTRGGLRLLLSGPGSSGSRPLPDGRRQEPGGWNRFVLDVDDLDAHIRALKDAGVRFRNHVEVGPGGRQIQIEDPDGNPIELHEPPAAAT